jgi:hypothetical protein
MSGIRALWRQISNLFQPYRAHDGDLPSEIVLGHHIIATARPAGHSPPRLEESGAQTTTYRRIALPIPFYIERLPTYNWSAVSILLVSRLLGKADSR